MRHLHELQGSRVAIAVLVAVAFATASLCVDYCEQSRYVTMTDSCMSKDWQARGVLGQIAADAKAFRLSNGKWPTNVDQTRYFRSDALNRDRDMLSRLDSITLLPYGPPSSEPIDRKPYVMASYVVPGDFVFMRYESNSNHEVIEFSWNGEARSAKELKTDSVK